MSNLTTRAGKGSPLTNNELDANFTNLNADKVEIGGDLSGTSSAPNVAKIQGRAVSADAPAIGEKLVWNGTAWEPSADPTNEPIGHEDKSSSSISFNSGTRTFTISPVAANFVVWCKGVKYTYTSAQTVVIPDTTGLHFIYFNASGVLSTQMSYFTWEEHAPTAYVYWNSTTQQAVYFGDERHGITLDWQTHEYLHRTRGAAIASGFGASGYTTTGAGATDADAQIDIGGGTFFDEDLQVDIVSTNTPVAGTWQQDLSGPARIPVLYLSGSAWVVDAPTNFPFKVVSGVPQYNLYSGGSWSTAPVTNNEYFVSWILATHNLTYPVIAVISQAPTNQLSAAEAMTFEGLNLNGFPSVEFRPLYKVIYQYKSGFTNSVKASTIAVYDIRSIAAAGVAAALVQDHGNLSGLGDDDHAQYLHVSEVRSPSSAVKNSFLPSQTSQSGKYLTTDGSNPSWGSIPSGSLTFTGDVTGSGTTGSSTTLTLANSGASAGTYTKVTVDAKGRVTTGASINSSDVTTALGFTPENSGNKGVANGYASLDGSGKVPSVQLPSYVDDVLEYANLAAFPGTGETGKIYIAIDTAKTYRWSGSAYVEISASPGSTDAVPEGSTNLYFTNSRARGAITATGSLSYNNQTGVLSYTQPTNVSTFTNDSGYLTGITGTQVTNALGYTPPQPNGTGATGTWGISITGNAATVSSITSGQVTTALGYTPYNSTNPSGYITNASLTWANISSKPIETALFDASVNSSTYWTVVRPNGSAIANPYVYRITLVTTGTGTDTGEVFLISNVDSLGWVVKTVARDASGSNRPYVFLDGGVPKVKNDHASLYNTRIMVEEFNAVSTGGLPTVFGLEGNFSHDQGTPKYRATWNGADNTLLHSGNYSSYSLPLSGGTMSGAILLGSGVPVRDVSGEWIIGKNSAEISIGSAAVTNGIAFNSASNSTFTYRGQQILHAGNYSSYSPSLTGGGASGTWGINITGNANTASLAIWSNQYNFSTSGAGWYRVATTGSDGRGTYNVELYCTGGSHNPSLLQICAQGDWGYDKIVYANWDGNFPASAVRITRGASNTFLEVYFTVAIAGATFRINRSGFDTSITPYTGSLPAGGDTVKDTLSIVSKINASGVYSSEQSRFGNVLVGNGTWKNVITPIDDTNLNILTPSGSLYTNNIFVNSNQVIHAGNYTSYSPSLTGSGASGTWGISVTGSAGSVGWANVSSGTRTGHGDIRFQPPASSYAGIQFLDTSGNHAAWMLLRGTSDVDVYTAEGLTIVADKGWLTLAQRDTAGKGVRLMSGVTSTERLKITTAGDIQFVNGNSFTYGGNAILHAGNYNSYSPTLTGGGASGTWGIGITGAINGITINQERASNPRIYSATTGAMGLLGVNSAGSFMWQLYGEGSTYGLLGSAWGAWDIKKAVNGELDIRVSSTERRVLHAANYNSYSPTLTGTGASGTWGISIGGSAAQLGGNSSSAYSGPASAVKQFFWDGLGANGTQARTFEIARLGIDYNDWNGGIGPFEVELYESYYSRGLKKKYVIYWGYSNVYGIQLVEYSGNGDNNFQVRIGTPVQVSGDNYYLPVFVDVGYYSAVDVRVTTNRDITASNPPGIGQTFINASPSATNIANFSPDSTVNFASTSSVQINGNVALHAANYNSYSPTLTGGGASGTWGISITGNAATAYGLDVHTGRNSDANKVVRTDANGYIQAGWINTTSGSAGTTAPDRIYGSYDGYIRYYTPANLKSVLSLLDTSGGTLTGNLSGTTIKATSGFYHGSTGYWKSRDNSGGSQFAIEYSTSATLSDSNIVFSLDTSGNAFRGNFATAYLHAANYNSYSPSLTGSGASGTWGISVTGSAGSASTATRSTIEDTRAGQRTPNAYDDYRASYEFTNQIVGGGDWHTAFTMQGWHDGYAAWQIIGPASTSAHENWYLRSGVNTTWNPTRAILHAGNYSSYALPLSGGTLTGSLFGTLGSFSGAVEWGSGSSVMNAGNPRSLRIGYSGGNYGAAGYGITFTTSSGVHNYAINDIVSYWEAYDGITVRAAAAGAVGTAVSWTNVLDARRSNTSMTFKGNVVLAANNYNSYSPTLTGGGASGTWGISITGGANTANNSSQLQGLTISQIFNNVGNSHGAYLDFNNIPGYGFYYVQGTGNGPGTGAGQFYGVTLGLGNDYAYSSYAMQLAIPRYAYNSSADRYLSIRNREAGTWGAWSKIHAGYADSAGSVSGGLTTSNYSSYALPLSGGTLTGQLNLHAGSYEGSITFGSSSTWRCGIRQHDDADAELRIWHANAAGMIFLATGYNGEPSAISRPTDGLAIQNNRLGIGNFSSSDPAYKLHVIGDIYATSNVTAYSDERVKTNWRGVGNDFIARLSGVKSGVYDRTDIEATQVGVSAQSLREVIPEAVMESAAGDLSVVYGNAAMVSAVELAKEIVNLKREIEMLKLKIH